MAFAIGLAKSLEPLLRSILGVVRSIETSLGPDDDWVEDDRRVLYEAFDDALGHATTMEKSEEDYVTTAHTGQNAIEELLYKAGYRRNLASTRKYRTHHDGGKQWACGSWVFDPEDTMWQHHVYLFRAPNGFCDIYAHRETSVRDPIGHLTDEQVHGDPNDRIRGILHEEVEYGQRELGKKMVSIK